MSDLYFEGIGIFTCELAKRITSPVEIEFMSVSSYGSGTSSSGVVRIVNDLGTSIEGKNVLVIEDIIDSGRTLSYLLENLKTRNRRHSDCVRFWISRTGEWWMSMWIMWDLSFRMNLW